MSSTSQSLHEHKALREQRLVERAKLEQELSVKLKAQDHESFKSLFHLVYNKPLTFKLHVPSSIPVAYIMGEFIWTGGLDDDISIRNVALLINDVTVSLETIWVTMREDLYEFVLTSPEYEAENNILHAVKKELINLASQWDIPLTLELTTCMDWIYALRNTE